MLHGALFNREQAVRACLVSMAFARTREWYYSVDTNPRPAAREMDDGNAIAIDRAQRMPLPGHRAEIAELIAATAPSTLNSARLRARYEAVTHAFASRPAYRRRDARLPDTAVR